MPLPLPLPLRQPPCRPVGHRRSRSITRWCLWWAIAQAGAAGLAGPANAAPSPAAAAPTLAPAPGPSPTSFYRNLQGVQLSNQQGQVLPWPALQGRLLLVNFIYTQCASLCSLQTRALAETRAALPPALRQQVQFLSVSLDPLSDTPAVLRAFAQRHGALVPGWQFATGRPQDIPLLVERLQLLDPQRDHPGLADHSTGLWLLDAQGELRQRYRGAPIDTARLARDLHALARATPRPTPPPHAATQP